MLRAGLLACRLNSFLVGLIIWFRMSFLSVPQHAYCSGGRAQVAAQRLGTQEPGTAACKLLPPSCARSRKPPACQLQLTPCRAGLGCTGVARSQLQGRPCRQAAGNRCAPPAPSTLSATRLLGRSGRRRPVQCTQSQRGAAEKAHGGQPLGRVRQQGGGQDGAAWGRAAACWDSGGALWRAGAVGGFAVSSKPSREGGGGSARGPGVGRVAREQRVGWAVPASGAEGMKAPYVSAPSPRPYLPAR